MKQRLPWLVATFIIGTFAPAAFAQVQPIQTGGFSSGPAPVTLVLLNQSRLADSTMADIANALTGKTAGIVLATRLSGVGVCGQGEWCLSITDQMLGGSSDAGAGAGVGSAIAKEILRKVLGALQM